MTEDDMLDALAQAAKIAQVNGNFGFRHVFAALIGVGLEADAVGTFFRSLATLPADNLPPLHAAYVGAAFGLLIGVSVAQAAEVREEMAGWSTVVTSGRIH